VANEAAMRADEIMAEQKKSPTFRELFPSVEPKPKIPKKIVEQKIDYKSQLPVDWNKMTRSERIDFVKKIQHKGFYAYVLSLDNDLAEYIKSTKKNVSKQSLSLYVNLFSFPSKSASDESKALLKSFVESLNMLGRARLEYVELVDPPVVEVREVRR
jgi:hypothetical protein